MAGHRFDCWVWRERSVCKGEDNHIAKHFLSAFCQGVTHPSQIWRGQHSFVIIPVRSRLVIFRFGFFEEVVQIRPADS
jgi:hypothetical protein